MSSSVIRIASPCLASVARAVIVATVLGVIGAANAVAQELREEPMLFRNDTVRLAGTLVLPRATGPHPAVVLVHGSGPDDGASYLHYARAFAAAGMAALVYDKRGYGNSGGDWRRRTVDALAGDALAGVAALRARPDILPQHVGLWGISQGGWVVARATARDSNVAFSVVVAGGGVSPTQQEMYHKDEIFRHLGYSDRARESALRVWRMIFDGLVLYANGKVPIPAGVMEGELSSAHFGLDYDPADDWRRVGRRGQPVLAVYGAEDRLTPVPETVARLRAALSSGGARDVVVRVFPRAGHTITTRQTGLRFDWDSAFAPGYLSTVSSWMVAHTGGPAAGPMAGVRAEYRSSPDFTGTGRYGRLPWYGRFYVQLAAVVVFALVFVAVGVGAMVRLSRTPVRRGRRAHIDQPSSDEPLAERRVRRLLVLVSMIDLALLLGFVAFIRAAVYPQGMGPVESYTLPTRYAMLPVAGVASAVLTVALVVAAVPMWRDTARWKRGRIGRTIVLAAAIAFVPWLGYWRLIGPPF